MLHPPQIFSDIFPDERRDGRVASEACYFAVFRNGWVEFGGEISFQTSSSPMEGTQSAGGGDHAALAVSTSAVAVRVQVGAFGPTTSSPPSLSGHPSSGRRFFSEDCSTFVFSRISVQCGWCCVVHRLPLQVRRVVHRLRTCPAKLDRGGQKHVDVIMDKGQCRRRG